MKSIVSTIIMLTCASVLLVSCESNHFFKSEKKLKNDIVGTWNRVLFGTDQQEEYWTFVNDTLKIYKPASGSGSEVSDAGTYSVDATVSSPFLKIEKTNAKNRFPYDGDTYNYKWTIVQLDNKVLEIATETPYGGVAQIEFIKQ
jgi:hypothetical protein